MKGTLYANPTFIRKNIRQPMLISIDPLVAYDEHRLFFNGASIKWTFKDIVNCTYLHRYQVLLVLTDDYKVYVFTQQLERITILHNWEPKYIVGFEFVEQLDLLLLIGTEEIEALKVAVVTNIKRTKFLSSMKFSLRREEHLAVAPSEALKWNRGYNYDVQENILYVWSTLDIHFFSLSKLTLKSKIMSLGKKENSLSIVLFNSHYKYTTTGMLNGDVKVWRLPTSSLYHHKEILIHNFTYHTRQVQHILPGADHRTILTSALDLYVCFMSLETFQILRVFNFSGQYSKIYLSSPTLAYALKDGYLGQLNFGLNMEFITDLTGEPLAYDRSPHLPLLQPPAFRRIQLTLNSNIAIELDLEEVRTASELNKVQLRHHYPPLKSKSILQVLSCPFEADRYFMMVEDGDIYSSKLEDDQGKIDRHCVLAKSLDSEKHSVNQMPSCLRFLQLVPPHIDTEIMERTSDPLFPASLEERVALYRELKLLAVGGTRGSIIFLPVNDLSNIYCRISYHREKIVNLQEAINTQTGCQWLISICQERFMKLINFEEGRANCLRTVFLGQLYLDVRGWQEHLVLVQPRGIFEICLFQQYGKEPRMVLNRESINHEGDLLSIDYRHDLRLLITGAIDGRIKIWNMSKVLIYEILAGQDLQHALWGLQDNLLVFLNNKMYGLREAISLSPKELGQLQDSFEEDFDIDRETLLTDYLRDNLAKFKEKQIRVRHVRRYVSEPDSPPRPSPPRHSEERVQTSRRVLKTEGRESIYRSSIMKEEGSAKRRKKARTEENAREEQERDNDLKAIKKHIEEISSVRKAANESIFPKLKPKSEDIFVDFMREKLLNKRLLTRRDITLNRIIMKNIIKDHLGDYEKLGGFKLD